jgi:membrane protein
MLSLDERDTMRKRLKSWRNQIDVGRLWHRIRDFLKYYWGGLYDRVGEDNIFLMASGLAFSLIVCLVPLILILFSVVGILLERPAISREISSYIDQLIPYQDYADQVKDIVFARVHEFRLHRTLAGVLGLLGLFLASTGLFSAMRTILNRVYKVKHPLAILRGKLRDFWLVILVLAYFILALTVLPFLSVGLEYARRLDILGVLETRFIQEFLLHIVTFVMTAFIYGLIYYTVPQTKPSKRLIIVSAVAAAVLWEIAKQAFAFYLGEAVIIKRIYGAYIFFVASAFWIYYSAIVFILGAEIGQLTIERRATNKNG